MKLDILAFGIHPDDVELSCGGTIAKHISMGYQIGICDLTRGEMGSRGSGELRLKEAENARNILGVQYRENLFLEDVWAEESKENILKIITIIRKCRPSVIFCNARQDRHPDHAKGARMVEKASFLAGLSKIETSLNNDKQEHFRPRALYHYIQFQFQKPDFVIDISGFEETKFEAIAAYSSQFYDPNSKEPETFISKKGFLEVIKANDMVLGQSIGCQFGEGFHVNRYIGVHDILKLL